MKMFYGMIGGTGTDHKLGNGYVENICCSAASMWTGKKFKRWTPPNHKLMFIDSGGFSFFYKSGDYPFSTEQYVELAETYKPDYLAVRDYPCEPDTARVAGLKTNKERIDATIRNTLECLKFKHLPWVAVVQGYKLSEYQYSCDQMKEYNIETPLIAIGSLCVRKKVADARRIIRVVQKNFPLARLHGFGIDFRFLHDPYIVTTLWSSDTQAWQFNNFGHGPAEYHLPTCEREKLLNFRDYQVQVDELLDRFEKNSKVTQEW
jgi:hypothetical protein